MSEFDKWISEEAAEDIAEQESEKLGRRVEQGLGHFPFEGEHHFQRLDTDGRPYAPEISETLRLVSAWFVKKDGKYYDVNNLQTSYNAQDIKQVIIQRMRVEFPLFSFSNNSLKDFFRVLLDPPLGKLNPEDV